MKTPMDSGYKIMEPTVIYEDENVVAVNKPAGWIVHAISSRKSLVANQEREKILTEWLCARYPAMKTVGDDPVLRPGIVHRLDRETSGVLIAAKNQAAFLYLKKQFQAREVKKTYLALVFGVPKNKSGEINLPIGIKTGTIKRSIHSAKMQKEALTRYHVEKVYRENCSELRVSPETGRTHQIRVHLTTIGHPILGDTLYGASRVKSFAAPRLMLHAVSLEIALPDLRRITIEAEPPDEFMEFVHGLHENVS